GHAQREAVPPAQPGRPTGLRARITARRRTLGLGLAAACLLLLGGVIARIGLEPPITQGDIDAAVAHSLETRRPVSPAVAAWEAIRPSVVRLRAYGADAKTDEEDAEEGNVGTGVVIVDNGTILTNLHVVAGAERIRAEFADGHVSDAVIMALDPKQDLAVVRARSVPDDLKPATMRSTADLAVGDQVVAAGFPFDIGPSVTSGVVSGLRREFRSPEGQRLLTNLIQFDAAANPGNSGGPLVDIQGQVVRIVTAIMNPTEQRVFVGIGFAVPIENAATAAGMPPF
ncbi:MAG TPA: trypsin-like peptidase domain-containing protein, partial [Burkholderiaceae bacterium]|nr:trypsin-like peptidase domain-containing protein [Burkholderiaceae bacterium]